MAWLKLAPGESAGGGGYAGPAAHDKSLDRGGRARVPGRAVRRQPPVDGEGRVIAALPTRPRTDNARLNARACARASAITRAHTIT